MKTKPTKIPKKKHQTPDFPLLPRNWLLQELHWNAPPSPPFINHHHQIEAVRPSLKTMCESREAVRSNHGLVRRLVVLVLVLVEQGIATELRRSGGCWLVVGGWKLDWWWVVLCALLGGWCSGLLVLVLLRGEAGEEWCVLVWCRIMKVGWRLRGSSRGWLKFAPRTLNFELDLNMEIERQPEHTYKHEQDWGENWDKE